jgi:hypothetical protein
LRRQQRRPLSQEVVLKTTKTAHQTPLIHMVNLHLFPWICICLSHFHTTGNYAARSKRNCAQSCRDFRVLDSCLTAKMSLKESICNQKQVLLCFRQSIKGCGVVAQLVICATLYQCRRLFKYGLLLSLILSNRSSFKPSQKKTKKTPIILFTIKLYSKEEQN